MAQTITSMVGAQDSLICSADWQALFDAPRSGASQGVLIRNTSSVAVEIGDPTHFANSSVYGWYKIPADSTFFVPFPNGVFNNLYAKGAGASIIYQEAVTN